VTEEHAAVLAMMLSAIGYSTAQIGELTAKIAVLCQPYEHQIAQPGAVPGTGVITAQDIIAEIGADYYERRANIRRQARSHVRGLERLGYKVTIEPADPAAAATGEPAA
jgi:hypothetical protein